MGDFGDKVAAVRYVVRDDPDRNLRSADPPRTTGRECARAATFCESVPVMLTVPRFCERGHDDAGSRARILRAT